MLAAEQSGGQDRKRVAAAEEITRCQPSQRGAEESRSEARRMKWRGAQTNSQELHSWFVQTWREIIWFKHLFMNI